jgi:L-2-hydroxyglutarate oxidase
VGVRGDRSAPRRTMGKMWDIAVVGGGIVGLATAWELSRTMPDAQIVVLEQEPELATHQTGHNSGVIHSGLYYRPGSLKAQLSTLGRRRLIVFLDQYRIPYALSGKVVVAVSADELPRLMRLFEFGIKNQVPQLREIGPEELHEIEPHVVGIRALYSPETGIVDYRQVALKLADLIRKRGHQILTGQHIRQIREESDGVRLIASSGQDFTTRYAIVAAGIAADRLARGAGFSLQSRMIPFRGDYLVMRPDRRHLVRSLVYPVPDPALPFLGVHFTKRLNDGAVWIGPNAVLTGARNVYRRGAVNPRDLFEVLAFPGFWRMFRRHWRAGLLEWYRDHAAAAYVRLAQRYLPELSPKDVTWGPMGIRAQLVDVSGMLVDDFRLEFHRRALFVLNAPSPAATSSLAIAEYVVQHAATTFGWTLDTPKDP